MIYIGAGSESQPKVALFASKSHLSLLSWLEIESNVKVLRFAHFWLRSVWLEIIAVEAESVSSITKELGVCKSGKCWKACESKQESRAHKNRMKCQQQSRL